jgi:galactokinase
VDVVLMTNRILIERVQQEYLSRFGVAAAVVARAPGRVNLLGEHVDYNDGFVMPAAIERATYVAFGPSPNAFSRVRTLDLDAEVVFTAASVAAKAQADGRALPDWGEYPAGVMHSLVQENTEVVPLNAVIASDVPRGSGLSSSAALELAFATAWRALGGWEMPSLAMAKLCQRTENQYVGVHCGIMDQFASACGAEDQVLMLDCRTLEWEELRLPGDSVIVIADTTIRRKLTSGEYNQRRADCEEAVRRMQSSRPEIRALRDVEPHEFEQLSTGFPEAIRRHARHVVEEIERTRRGRICLQAGDAAAFGRLMNETHASLRDLFEVSSAELNLMAEIAQGLPGCYGARLTGAGFGGCTVNLVNAAQAEAFVLQLASEFNARTGLEPEVFVTRPSNGAGVLIS